MLKVGDKVKHYVDDIEGYRVFEIVEIAKHNRCTLKGVNTKTNLSRILDNERVAKTFHYEKVL